MAIFKGQVNLININDGVGKDGNDAQSFGFETNQMEVLKFVSADGTLSFSPEILSLSVYKKDLSSENGQMIIKNLVPANLLIRVFNAVGGTWLELTTEAKDSLVSVTGEEDSTFEFNLLNFSKMAQSEESARIFAESESIIEFIYVYSQEENTYRMSSYVYFRYGMNKDMASLSLKANGIVASIQNSSLEFNANGLTVNNGSIRILNNDGKEVLVGDSQTGNLTLSGTVYAEAGQFTGTVYATDGKFTGIIEATDGYFTGELKAVSGKIGGFEIKENQLVSTDNLDAPSIILNGEKGEITAENINLGTGAKIKDYIQLGETVFLRNVSALGDAFITVKDVQQQDLLQLKSDGNLVIGNDKNSIVINGENGEIYSQSFNDGLGWKISNYNSIFNDVTIKGSIKASVIEYGAVQAIGGMLLVRPSSRIISIVHNSDNQTSNLTLESVEGFENEDYCLIDNGGSKTYYKIIEINLENKIVTLEGIIPESYAAQPIINFGKAGAVGIGINGSTNGTLITPQSISVFDFDGVNQITPRVILGKLPNEDAYGFAKNTYGLYAENVLLKGSLVTQTNIEDSSATYSGISTLYSGEDSPNSSKYAEWFEGNTGEILIWAGAEGTTKEQIENSNFFVDRYGNLFAGSGYFKGTIITDAKITASEIETAKLTGVGDSPALTIQDAKQGIVFLSGADGVNKEVFKLAENSIKANVAEAIFNDRFKIKENGDLVLPTLYVVGESSIDQVDETVENKAIIIEKDRISYSTNFKESESFSTFAYIDFTSGIALSPDGKLSGLEITTQQIKTNSTLYINKSVKYNELMEYKPVYLNNELIGYDLYIE